MQRGYVILEARILNGRVIQDSEGDAAPYRSSLTTQEPAEQRMSLISTNSINQQIP